MKKLPFIYILLLLVLFPSCYLMRGLVYWQPDIDDAKHFPASSMHANNKPFIFNKGTVGNNTIPQYVMMHGKEVLFEDFLLINQTVAYLIIRNDTIVYEKYFMGKDSSSAVPSFAMANAYTSALIGCALHDGLIQSVDEPITNYLPELRKNGLDSVTIQHLLQMTSGIKFKENYNSIFSDANKLYYSDDAKECLKDLHLIEKPGTLFHYNSGNTQLLGWILQRALKGETVTHYLDRRIWFRIEPEYDGSWSLDKKENGLEKTFCCINATARDYAKFGRLYMNSGKWQDKEIVPARWVQESLTPSTEEGGVDDYKYQWWIRNKNGENAFMASGYLGQYIYVCPSKNIVIVRLGEDNGSVDWARVFNDYVQQVD